MTKKFLFIAAFSSVSLFANEMLIKQVNVQVGVQRHLQLAATVELFQYSRKVMYIETDFLQLCNLRYAFQGKLIIGIER